MLLDLQYKIKNDPKMYEYLKQNSNWIKYLNRNSNLYPDFKKNIKEIYKLRTTDKINNAIDNIDMISNILKIIK